MNKEQRIELAKRLINVEINRTMSMWANPEDLYTYAWEWRNNDTVSNNHGNQFFNADEVLNIVHALRLNYSLTICNNCDGEPTPAISIF